MNTFRRTLTGLALAAGLLTAGSAPAWAAGCGSNGSTLICPRLEFVTTGFSPAEAAGIGVGGLMVGAAVVTLATRRRGGQIERSEQGE